MRDLAARIRGIDRYTGLAIALPLVTITFYILTLFRLPDHVEAEPIPMTVLIDLSAPEPPNQLFPPPTPDSQAAEPDVAPPTAATRVGSQEEGEDLVDPVKGEPDGGADELPVDLEAMPGPAKIADWVPTTKESAELRALVGKVSDKASEVEKRVTSVKEKLIAREVKSAAKDFEINSDGGMAGAIRLLDIDSAPEDITKRVLSRYDIKFERRYVSAVAGRNYLNAAKTDAGTYNNVKTEGLFDVLVLSTKAISFMATREVTALQNRGYDPRTTRVRKIVFGIMLNEVGEYDLDVKALEVEEVR